MQKIRQVLEKPSNFRNKDEIINLAKSKSVMRLAQHLGRDEKVLRMAKGAYSDLIGILAATNKKVIFISRGVVLKTEIEISYHDILTAVSVRKLFNNSIMIKTDKGVFTISKVSRRHSKRLARFIDGKSADIRKDYIKNT